MQWAIACSGREFEVVGLEEGQVMIRWGRGEWGSFESLELAHLDYALVNTTYAAQGKSAERVIGALDRHVGRESFYVAVSRVKRELRLYVSEDLERLIERVERSRAKENPGELLSQEAKSAFIAQSDYRSAICLRTEPFKVFDSASLAFNPPLLKGREATDQELT